jgi:head-tail adaptor
VSLLSLLIHDVTLQTPTRTENRYGDAAKTSWTVETVKAWISQSSRTEDSEGREAAVSSWVLYVDADTTVSTDMRVVWRGLTFEVDGPPLPAWTPRGEHHQEVTLRRVVG